jgi:MFS family permease
MPSPHEVDRAIRCSYAQNMLWTVFRAATGGIFLTGFALKLGADDRMIARINALPQICVVLQFLGAMLVEREISRKKMAFRFGFVMPSCWLLIAVLPFLGSNWARGHIPGIDAATPSALAAAQFAILIAVLALANAADHMATSARQSWIGELIPRQRQGRFFGNAAMFAMLISAVCALAGGLFLDLGRVKEMGTDAFTLLFTLGGLAGLATILLYVPQPDCPLPAEETRPSIAEVVRRMMRNRPFLNLALVQGCLSLTSIANPFFQVYQIRDVGLSYFWVAFISAVWMAVAVVTSPLWGRAAGRFGYKPVITLGFVIWTPATLLWLGVPPGCGMRAVWLISISNVIAGAGQAAISVGLTTAVYKASQPVGRSVQLAFYNAFVVLAGVPMPILGAMAVSRLQQAGYHADLRITFYAMMGIVFLTAFVCRRLIEPDAASVRTLVRTAFARPRAEGADASL